MMQHSHSHGDLMSDVVAELQDIFEHSDQGVYVFLDEQHIACNAKFAEWLGYSSPAEWAKASASFTEAFVAEKSQATLVSAYTAAMEKRIGSTVSVTWKKKYGEQLSTTVILVPVSFADHLVALHFISK